MKKKILSLVLVAVLALAAIGGTLAYFTDTDEVQNEFTMGKVKIDLWETNPETNEKEQEGIEFDAPIVPGHNFDKNPSITVEANSEESYVFLDMSFNKYSSLFWVMAADAAADTNINLPLYTTNNEGKQVLADTFKNDKGVFGTTKFLEYMVQNPETMQQIVTKWFTGIDHTKWETCDIIMKNPTSTYITLRFLYIGQNAETKTVAKADTDTELGAFFTDFHMPASVTQEMIESGKTVGDMQNSFNTESENFHMNFNAYAIQADTLTAAQAYKALFNIDLDTTIVQ